MNQACLNIAVGLVLLITSGWKWREGKLNLGVFSVAMFHLVVGILIAVVGVYPEKGMRYYLFTRTENADNYIIPYVQQKSYLNSIFIGVEVVVATVGLVMLFTVTRKRKLHRVILILVMQAFFVILACIV